MRYTIILSVALTMLPLAVTAVVFARPGGAPPACWERKELNNSIQCDGSCTSYTVCPGRILCMPGSTNNYASPITYSIQPCHTYTGGTGACPACGGGVLVIPDVITTPGPIPVQSCSGGCP
ncbi:MAG: hypothetical protein JNM07_04315 [Phycisphaerae bacterium]|nr:hypothetical protein [Phycisphaerae bacterium]